MKESTSCLPGSASRIIPINKTGSSSCVPDVHINIKNVDPDEVSEVSVSEISQSVTHVVQIKRLNRPSSVYQPKILIKNLLDEDESDSKKAESSNVAPVNNAVSTFGLPKESEFEGQVNQEVLQSNAPPDLYYLQRPPESAEVDHVIKTSETFAAIAVSIITVYGDDDDVIIEEETSDASVAVALVAVDGALPPTSNQTKLRLEKIPSIASADDSSVTSSQFDVSEISLDLGDVKWEESRAYSSLPQPKIPLIAISSPPEESVCNLDEKNVALKTLAPQVEQRELKPASESSIDEAINDLIQSTQFDVDFGSADANTVKTVTAELFKTPRFEIGNSEKSVNQKTAMASLVDNVIEPTHRDVVDGTPKLAESTATMRPVIMFQTAAKVFDVVEESKTKNMVDSEKPLSKTSAKNDIIINVAPLALKTTTATLEMETREYKAKSLETTVNKIFSKAVDAILLETADKSEKPNPPALVTSDDATTSSVATVKDKIQPLKNIKNHSVTTTKFNPANLNAAITSSKLKNIPTDVEKGANAEFSAELTLKPLIEVFKVEEPTENAFPSASAIDVPVDTHPATTVEDTLKKPVETKKAKIPQSQELEINFKDKKNLKIPVFMKADESATVKSEDSVLKPPSNNFLVAADEPLSESDYPLSGPDKRPIIHQQSFEIPIIFEKKSIGEWPVTESEDEVSTIEHSFAEHVETPVTTSTVASETAITVQDVTSDGTASRVVQIKKSVTKPVVTPVELVTSETASNEAVPEAAKVTPTTTISEFDFDIASTPDENETNVNDSYKNLLLDAPDVTLHELIAKDPIQFEYDTDIVLDVDVDNDYSEAAKTLSTIAEEHSEAISPSTPDLDLFEKVQHITEIHTPIKVTEKTLELAKKVLLQPTASKPEDEDKPIEQVVTTGIFQMTPLPMSQESVDLSELVRKQTLSFESNHLPAASQKSPQQTVLTKFKTPEPSVLLRKVSKDSLDTQSVTQTDDLTYVTVQTATSGSEYCDRRPSTPTERVTPNFSSASDNFFDATEDIQNPLKQRERSQNLEKDLTPVVEVVTLHSGDIDVTVENVIDEEDYKPVIRLRKRESKPCFEEQNETTSIPEQDFAFTSKISKDETQKHSKVSIIKPKNNDNNVEANASQKDSPGPNVNNEPSVVIKEVKQQEPQSFQLLKNFDFKERYQIHEEKLFRELAAHPVSPIFDQSPLSRKTPEDVRKSNRLTEIQQSVVETKTELSQEQTVLLSPQKQPQENQNRSPHNKSPITGESIIRDLRKVNLEITQTAVKSPSPGCLDEYYSPRTLTRIHNLNVIWENGTEIQNNGQLKHEHEGGDVIHHHPVFVKDTSKYWYKPTISREDAISMLREKPPGTFVVRDSNSFPGAFGLALKVAKPPEGVPLGDGNELVRHFLIEPSAKGVKLKGCNNEPVFGTLAALVYQHSITPMALPCRLLLPEYDPASTPEHLSAAQALLEQGAACNVTYIYSFDTESLTGPEAVRRAVAESFVQFNRGTVRAVNVHFKVSAQGITLTDNTRTLFFRRHYPANSVIFAGIDPEDRKWDNNSVGQLPPTYVRQAKIFGFVARKISSSADNACHVFAELDPEQPASAVVNFITKVMMAQNQTNRSRTPDA